MTLQVQPIPVIFCEQNSDGERWFFLFDTIADTFPFIKQMLDELEGLTDGAAAEFYMRWVNGEHELEVFNNYWLYITSEQWITDYRQPKPNALPPA